MKKFLLLGLVSLLLCGCTPVPLEEEVTGEYKEGTYFGYSQKESYGNILTTTAVVYVNESGVIKSVFIDSTYIHDEKVTTKKALGDDYGMKETSANIGNIEGGAEWYEQAKAFEDKIVKEQGLDWLEWSDSEKTKTDSVSGVTITVDEFVKAVDDALDKAK